MRSSAPADRALLTFVIPWYGDDARGGAELQGWETAREMAARGMAVELLTTCSRSFMHRWDDNHHAPGVTVRDNVTVRRFAVDRRNEAVFGGLNARLLDGGRLTSAEQQSFIRENINSAALEEFIEREGDRRIFVFLPYLYGTTVAGAARRPDRSLLMPCFHDEPYAYLEPVRRMFGEVRGMLYLSPEEGLALDRVMGAALPGRVVGGGIDTTAVGDAARFRGVPGMSDPFMLYVGRLDRGKNTHLLAGYFHHWRRHRGRRERLLLMGGGEVDLPSDASIRRLGVLDDRQRTDACAAAFLLCQPSVNESFSRVIMEAWLQETPVLVSAACPVTVGHVRRSGGGLYFDDYHEFEAAVELLAGNEALRRRMGQTGRRYVLAEFHWDVVCRRVIEAVRELSGVELLEREGTGEP